MGIDEELHRFYTSTTFAKITDIQCSRGFVSWRAFFFFSFAARQVATLL